MPTLQNNALFIHFLWPPFATHYNFSTHLLLSQKKNKKKMTAFDSKFNLTWSTIYFQAYKFKIIYQTHAYLYNPSNSMPSWNFQHLSPNRKILNDYKEFDFNLHGIVIYVLTANCRTVMWPRTDYIFVTCTRPFCSALICCYVI